MFLSMQNTTLSKMDTFFGSPGASHFSKINQSKIQLIKKISLITGQ